MVTVSGTQVLHPFCVVYASNPYTENFEVLAIHSWSPLCLILKCFDPRLIRISEQWHGPTFIIKTVMHIYLLIRELLHVGTMLYTYSCTQLSMHRWEEGMRYVHTSSTGSNNLAVNSQVASVPISGILSIIVTSCRSFKGEPRK